MGRSDATGEPASHSPWPLLVALGLVASEFGILVGSLPIAVFGLLLLGGGGSGLAHEAGYGSSSARLMQLLGGLFALAGGAVLLVRGPAPTPSALLVTEGLARRETAVVVAGCLLVLVGTAGRRLSELS